VCEVINRAVSRGLLADNDIGAGEAIGREKNASDERQR
jgi:hypothetical protein